jgi:hypothetical protein
VLLAGTGVFLLVAVAAGIVALAQRGEAREEARRADAQRLGSLAATEASLDRAVLLAVAGVQLDDGPETRGDLLAILQKTPDVLRLLHPSRSEVTAVALRPDSRLLASADGAGVVHFHDATTWRARGRGVRLDGPVSQESLAFSPDGATLAAATAAPGNRANLHLVKPATGRARMIGSWPSVPAALGPRRFTRLAFSPDGRRLAVAVATAAAGVPVPSPSGSCCSTPQAGESCGIARIRCAPGRTRRRSRSPRRAPWCPRPRRARR